MLILFTDKEVMGQMACDSFTAILRYMGDLPNSKRSRLGNECTDAIFEPPLRHVSLSTAIINQSAA